MTASAAWRSLRTFGWGALQAPLVSRSLAGSHLQECVPRRWRLAKLRSSPACQQDVNSWRMPEFNPPAGQEAAVVAAPGPANAPAPRKGPSPSKNNGKKKTFEQRYRELTLFYMEHGNCMVPINCPSGLGGWVAYQRRLWKSRQLPLDQYHQLAALGFQFDAFAARWAARFRQLADFHSRYGHCTVPADALTEARWPGLRQWTLIQRQAWKRGVLEDDRVRRLSGLGFVWQPGEVQWEERFAELQAFKQEHGHCNVPKGWAHNQGLASWVERVRRDWRARQGVRTLSHSREARLRELGFDFEPQQRSWEERYVQLREVQAREGHLAGPFPGRGVWAGLGDWVMQQRHKARAGRLHPDRQRALSELGFVWEVEEGAWAKQLAVLDALLARVGPKMARALLEGKAAPAPHTPTAVGAELGAACQPPHSAREPAVQPGVRGASKWGRGSCDALGPPLDQAPAAGGQRKRRNGGPGARPVLREEGQAPRQIFAGREVTALARWYRAAKRAAAAGELTADRAAQLAQRGLGLTGVDWDAA